jgi:RNA polymerase sigma-70 factor, ECF subfamily
MSKNEKRTVGARGDPVDRSIGLDPPSAAIPSIRSAGPGKSPPQYHAPVTRLGPDPDPTDHELVARIQAGESGAWADLARRYQHRLFTVCLRMVGNREAAADLTQDAFVKILEGLATFDGRSKPSTWMIRVTMNVCLSWLRSEKHRRHASLDAAGWVGPDGAGGGSAGDLRPGLAPGSWRRSPAAEPGGASSIQRSERQALLSAALDRLKPEQRAILVLRDVRDMEYEQIAEALGIPGGTVKSRLFRARTALREAMEQVAAESSDLADELRDEL